MRKTFFLFLSLVFASLLSVRAESCLVLQLRDGTQLSYVLSQQPVITFDQGLLKLKSDHAGAVFELSNIENFHFDDAESGIPEVQANERRFRFVDGMISVQGHQDQVLLTDLSGHVLHSTSRGQTFTYDLKSQPRGTYLMRIGGESIKLYNK